MKFSKTYDPSSYETDIYALWERAGVFTPRSANHEDSFSMVLPPPNANGNLHVGHALDFQLKDTIARYQRQQGKHVLLLPGADHAGLETWVVYEKHLSAQGKSRFDYSRDQLHKMVWDFVESNKSNMTDQVRRLGISCDWTRFAYTLDDQLVTEVYRTFQKMWNDGLIYRGRRLVNYCSTYDTSYSDIEIDYKQVEGKLWHIRYPLTGSKKYVVVATTRPETMLGDAAVAVHPDDDRYRDLVGKTVDLPLTDRQIPIIADEMVDTDFGSGAVKITPAHDFDDYEVGQRHELPMIEVIDKQAKITDSAPRAYVGLDVEDARKKVVEDLDKLGLIDKIEKHTHNVGHCYKSGTVLQPIPQDQWFVKMAPLAKEAIKRIKADQINFYPMTKQSELIDYLENLRDWNISRQIAWGIPIPAFQNIADEDDWIFNSNVGQEQIEVDGKTYRRDPDVFDTWFSSGQWPFSTLGYPDSPDAKQFFPTDLMETGTDLLRPWVSKMIMLSLYITGELPFKTVYYHGMVVDAKGQKFSKSKGNGINPLDLIDKYSSDALRLALMNGTAAGSPQPLSEDKLIAGRNFCNKLWNIARYIDVTVKPNQTAEPLTSADHWILQRIDDSLAEVNKQMQAYRINEAYEAVYRFVWNDFADWYLEANKRQKSDGMLRYVLEVALKLTHPFAPHVTEAIWQLITDDDSVLASQAMSPSLKYDQQQANTFEQVRQIVNEVRNICSNLKVSHPAMYYSQSELIDQNQDLIVILAKLKSLDSVEDGRGMRLTKSGVDAWLDIDSTLAKDYLDKLGKDVEGIDKSIESLNKRLANRDYVKRAPAQVVEESRQQLRQLQHQKSDIEAEIKDYREYFVD